MLDRWAGEGSHRRDVDGDNVIEHGPAIAVMDDWWPLIARGMFEPVLGETVFDAIRGVSGFGSPPPSDGSAFGSGWWSEASTDLRSLVGAPCATRCRGPTADAASAPAAGGSCSTRRGGDRERQGALRRHLARGHPDGGRVRRRRPLRRDPFMTAGAVGMPDIPWQDRPTFQQIVEVQGHRPR